MYKCPFCQKEVQYGDVMCPDFHEIPLEIYEAKPTFPPVEEAFVETTSAEAGGPVGAETTTPSEPGSDGAAKEPTQTPKAETGDVPAGDNAPTELSNSENSADALPGGTQTQTAGPTVARVNAGADSGTTQPPVQTLGLADPVAEGVEPTEPTQTDNTKSSTANPTEPAVDGAAPETTEVPAPGVDQLLLEPKPEEPSQPQPPSSDNSPTQGESTTASNRATCATATEAELSARAPQSLDSAQRPTTGSGTQTPEGDTTSKEPSQDLGSTETETSPADHASRGTAAESAPIAGAAVGRINPKLAVVGDQQPKRPASEPDGGQKGEGKGEQGASDSGDQKESTPKKSAQTKTSQPTVEKSKTMWYVLGGVGVAAIVGAVFFMTQSKPAPVAASPAAAPSVGPTINATVAAPAPVEAPAAKLETASASQPDSQAVVATPVAPATTVEAAATNNTLTPEEIEREKALQKQKQLEREKKKQLELEKKKEKEKKEKEQEQERLQREAEQRQQQASAPKPAPAPAANAWLSNLRSELATCEAEGTFKKMFCTEKVRWKYCAPDRWGTVAECPGSKN